jgi:hypothetical protein
MPACRTGKRRLQVVFDRSASSVCFPAGLLNLAFLNSVIVWDIETVPDIKGFSAANGHDGKGDDEIRAAMGDKFPKHIYHSIICIGALVAHQEKGRWTVMRLARHTSGNALKRR